MKGDFSRSSFDPQKHYQSVRMQQGRVQLDADWNEQADILLHLIRTQLNDLLGPGATAVTEPGFAITLVESAEEVADQAQAGQPGEPTLPARTLPNFQIGAGRYYVEGMLCENEAPVLFSRQPDYPDAKSLLRKAVDLDHFLVYLDVWQRHVTAIQDPAIREIALGGLDTTTRVKTVWQVKLLALSGDPADDQGCRDGGGLRSLADWQAFVAQAGQKGLLKARWDHVKGAALENRLYRVEIHTVADHQVEFKWSRENGAVVFPIRGRELEAFTWEEAPQSANEDLIRFLKEDLALDWVKDPKISKSADGKTIHIEKDGDWVKIMLDEEEKTATLTTSDEGRRLLRVTEENGKRKLYSIAYLGRSQDGIELNLEGLDRDPHQLQVDSWVELVDDVTVLSGRPLPLCQVEGLDRPNARVTLHEKEKEEKPDKIDQILAEIGARELHHPLLRRWEAEAKLVIGSENPAGDQGKGWLELENGIQVAFSGAGTYRVGDYWLIPARTRSRDGIDWPQKDGQPLAQPPNGIVHHYAPLALLQFQEGHWSVFPEESSAFRSLPQITANLAATDGQVEAAFWRLDQLEAFSRLDQLKVALSRLREVQKTAEALAEQTHVFTTVKSKQSLEKGDLVSLDRASAERRGADDPGTEVPVKLASSREGRLVVGVVTEPMDDQRFRVALFGRVRCKVIGPVEPGDLLVPADKPGHAQKRGWFLRKGPIIGKALSSTAFDEGKRTGTVDMLVTLG